jgi:anti-sigma-K factor RskA
MSSNRNDQVIIRQYLLGQLTGESLNEFEHRLFSDDELFAEVLATEDELIESSIANELGQDEAEWFTKYFLITPEREQQLQFRKILQRVTKAEKHDRLPNQGLPQSLPWRPPSWMSWAVATVAAMIIMAAAIQIIRSPQNLIAEVTLTPGSSERGSGGHATSRITLSPEQHSLKIHLALPQSTIPTKDYRVEMLRSDEDKSKSFRAVSHSEQSVEVVVPASDLARGFYAFNLFAIKADGSEQRIPGTYLLRID